MCSSFLASSGAGTNLKVGEEAPVQSESGEAPIGRKAPEKKFFFGHAPPLFGSKSTINRFGERFRDGQYSLVSFLFAVLLLTVSPCPVICKSGGARNPSVPHGVGATDYSLIVVGRFSCSHIERVD